MGGRIALELALTHPGAVRKLILVSTGARVIKTWQRSLMFNVMPRLPVFKGDYPQPYYAFSRQRDASQCYNCVDRLPEIKVPALIMHGKKDRVARIELAEELHAGLAGSKLFTFEGGHIFFLMRERGKFPDTMAECLAA